MVVQPVRGVPRYRNAERKRFRCACLGKANSSTARHAYLRHVWFGKTRRPDPRKGTRSYRLLRKTSLTGRVGQVCPPCLRVGAARCPSGGSQIAEASSAGGENTPSP